MKNNEEHKNRAKEVHAALKTVYGSKSDDYARGICGEVATALAFYINNFDVYTPTKNEDGSGKIDLWVDPRDGDIYAIQVKTLARGQELEVILPKIKNGKVSGLDPAFGQDMQEMVEFLSNKAQNDELHVIPMLIIVPAGRFNEHSMFNPLTGEPTKDYITQLNNKIDELIFSKEVY